MMLKKYEAGVVKPMGSSYSFEIAIMYIRTRLV